MRVFPHPRIGSTGFGDGIPLHVRRYMTGMISAAEPVFRP